VQFLPLLEFSCERLSDTAEQQPGASREPPAAAGCVSWSIAGGRTFGSIFEVLAMAHDRKPHSWLRPTAIAFAVFATWFALSVLVFQDSRDDPPLIVSLLSN
jgi:hypothetical protein